MTVEDLQAVLALVRDGVHTREATRHCGVHPIVMWAYACGYDQGHRDRDGLHYDGAIARIRLRA